LLNKPCWVLNMSSKHRGTMAKEIVDQASGYFEKQRGNLSAQELERKPLKRFEPTPSFSRVFSETVGKKTRPSMGVNLKENPRLINPSENSTQQSKENETEHIAKLRAQEFKRKPLKKLEPTADFYEVFSEIIGRKPDKRSTM